MAEIQPGISSRVPQAKGGNVRDLSNIRAHSPPQMKGPNTCQFPTISAYSPPPPGGKRGTMSSNSAWASRCPSRTMKSAKSVDEKDANLRREFHLIQELLKLGITAKEIEIRIDEYLHHIGRMISNPFP
jgi:hypothetical protein